MKQQPPSASSIFVWRSDTECGRIASSIDWAKHPLGPVEKWPAQLRAALNIILESYFPMFVSWGKERFFFYNDAYARILANKHPSAFGGRFREIWSEIWPDIEPLILSVDQGKASYLEDLELIMNRTGRMETTYFTFSYSPIRGDTGEVLGLFSVVFETTQRKKSEDALKKSEESRSLALVSARMGTWDIEIPSNQVTLSPEARRLLGIDRNYSNPQEAIGDFIHPDDRERAELTIDRALQSRSAYNDEYRIIRPDGEMRWINAFGRAKYDNKGRPTSISGLIADITERKNSEEALQQALLVRDEFLSVASHELKTPLTSLKLQAQMLVRQYELKGPAAVSAERMQKFAEQTLRQVNRLSRLVDDMLDISRIQTKKLALLTEQVNLCELVLDVVDRLNDQFVLVGGEPPHLILCERAVGNWDRMRIEQVVINLLTNVLRYGRGKPVEIRVQVEGASVHLFVKDQGIGMSKEVQTKIFDRFERAVDSNEVSGLGLGLYISRQIVEAHGGTIRVESELGQGTTFEVTLPLIRTSS